MIKKVIATLFTVIIIAHGMTPLLSNQTCNTSFHQLTTCCQVQIAEECTVSNASCTNTGATPVITVPSVTVKHQVALSRPIAQNSDMAYSASSFNRLFVYLPPQPESPPAYQTPLLI
ncbi:MAG: hypothetical protein GXO90_01255 [FCB group bacterium]|nr:hypothetical protein [FCB group bacterium]